MVVVGQVQVFEFDVVFGGDGYLQVVFVVVVYIVEFCFGVGEDCFVVVYWYVGGLICS